MNLLFDYIQNQKDEIVFNLTHLNSPTYFWLNLYLFIRIYRYFNKNGIDEKLIEKLPCFHLQTLRNLPQTT